MSTATIRRSTLSRTRWRTSRERKRRSSSRAARWAIRSPSLPRPDRGTTSSSAKAHIRSSTRRQQAPPSMGFSSASPEREASSRPTNSTPPSIHARLGRRARRSFRSRTRTTARAGGCGVQRPLARSPTTPEPLASHRTSTAHESGTPASPAESTSPPFARRSTRSAFASRRASGHRWEAPFAHHATSSPKRGGSASDGAARCGRWAF